MKYSIFKMILLALPLLLIFNLSSALADDDKYDRAYEEKESWMEDVGESLGWGTVIVALAAGILLPARRMVKPMKERFPEGQKSLLFIIKGLTKYHVWIGVIAVGTSLVHGLSMYLTEDELGLRDWLGAFSATLMLIAGIIGGILAVNRQKIKNWKKIHLFFLLAAGVFAIIHILAS